ncbi:Uncharacterised protein [Mycobacteroides abscessus]|nr:Uncharacterised protein [Mycobacteroides abscessus]
MPRNGANSLSTRASLTDTPENASVAPSVRLAARLSSEPPAMG